MTGAGRLDLDRLAPAWDAAVERTPGADPFCASTDWSFAAAEAFDHAGPAEVIEAGAALYGCRQATTADGARVVLGLDPVWGFATPVVGDAAAGARCVVERLRRRGWDVAVLTGQRLDMPLTLAVARHVDASLAGVTALVGPEEHRLRADLGGGFEAWWARRSPRFRQRLRRLEREATAAGLSVEDIADRPAEEVVDRCVAVEATTWKGRDGVGFAGSTEPFYRAMARRLAGGRRLRALVARLDGADVGFVLGGVRGPTYRGFQLGYAAAAAPLGVGHLLQLEQVRRLVAERVRTYDLGMDMAYKRRWADADDTTFALLLRR